MTDRVRATLDRSEDGIHEPSCSRHRLDAVVNHTAIEIVSPRRFITATHHPLEKGAKRKHRYDLRSPYQKLAKLTRVDSQQSIRRFTLRTLMQRQPQTHLSPRASIPECL